MLQVEHLLSLKGGVVYIMVSLLKSMKRIVSKTKKYKRRIDKVQRSIAKAYSTSVTNYNNITLAQVDTLSGEDFELFVSSLFIKMGYGIETTPVTGDYGADLVLSSNKGPVVVQCKRYSSNIGVSAVQEVVSAKPMYGAVSAMVVSNAEFTKAAQVLANANGVRLIGRTELAKLLRRI